MLRACLVLPVVARYLPQSSNHLLRPRFGLLAMAGEGLDQCVALSLLLSHQPVITGIVPIFITESRSRSIPVALLDGQFIRGGHGRISKIFFASSDWCGHLPVIIRAVSALRNTTPIKLIGTAIMIAIATAILLTPCQSAEGCGA